MCKNKHQKLDRCSYEVYVTFNLLQLWPLFPTSWIKVTMTIDGLGFANRRSYHQNVPPSYIAPFSSHQLADLWCNLAIYIYRWLRDNDELHNPLRPAISLRRGFSAIGGAGDSIQVTPQMILAQAWNSHVLGRKQRLIPSRQLTYPTLGKGKSSSKCHFWGKMMDVYKSTFLAKKNYVTPWRIPEFQPVN